MGNAPPISEKKLKELRLKYDKDDNGLSWEEFRELAVEVGELQGLSKPVSDEKLRKIFEGLDADKSGIVSIQEFEAAYAKLEEQLQAAAKAKAKAKANAKGKAKAESKAKAEGKAKGKPKAKPKAAADAEASGEAVADVSIFDALPGFGSFVPELPTAESLVPELPDLGVGAAMAAAFAEDTTVKAQAIPTPKKIKAPPLPEPAPPALSTHVPWSTQLKAADPDWYDEDDAGFTSDDDFPDVGEVPEESKVEELPSAAPKVPPKPKAPTPKPAVAKPKAPKARSTSPKAKAKGLPKPQVKPKVEPKGRAQGISAADGVTEDVFSSPIHRREAVAHPAKQADPHPVRVLQTAGGMDLVQQDPEVLSEPESQESVDSISGEIARSWDPGAKDARYSYARDRAVGFSEFWQPLKWSEEEWERRLLASGNLRRKVGIAKHTPKATMEENPKDKAAPVAEDHEEVEELIAPEKPKPRSQYPLATEVKPKFIDVPLSGLQGVAADGAVSALRKNAKTPAAPVFGDPLDDELYGAGLPLPTPGRPGEPLVPLAAVAPAHLRERAPETPPDTPADAPRFGYPGWQPPAAVFSDSNRTLLRPMMQEVQPRHRQVEGREQGPGDYGDQPGRTWL